MKLPVLFVLLIFSSALYAQNGYVKIERDSVLVGFLKYYVSYMDGQQGIEFWRTKWDKEPLRISRREILEYAIKKDTFIVLHQYSPFNNSRLYFELVDAKRKLSGKVNLYIVVNKNDPSRVSTYTGGGLIPAIIDESLGNYHELYLLENRKTGLIKPLPKKKEKLHETLLEFFPEKFIQQFCRVKEALLHYGSVPRLVKYYNSY